MISGRSTKQKVQDEEKKKKTLWEAPEPHSEVGDLQSSAIHQVWHARRSLPTSLIWHIRVLLILYAVFYFMYKLCGTPKEMSSPLLQVPQAWNAQGSFWKHEKFNMLRLGEALNFKTTSEVDGGTSEQPRTTSISEVIKCCGWATAVLRRRWGKI